MCHMWQSQPFCFFWLHQSGCSFVSLHYIYVFYSSRAFIQRIKQPCIPKDFLITVCEKGGHFVFYQYDHPGGSFVSSHYIKIYYNFQGLSFGISHTPVFYVTKIFLKNHIWRRRPFCFWSVRPPGGSFLSCHYMNVLYSPRALIWCITNPCIPITEEFLEIPYVTKAAILFLIGTAARGLFPLLSLHRCILLFQGFHLVYHTHLFSL